MPPEIIAARLQGAEEGASTPATSRSEWRSRGQHAIVLWDRAHQLLADVRAVERLPGSRRQVESLAATHGRWLPPAPLRAADLSSLVGTHATSRTAYLWLAFVSGSSLAELFHVLFARRGHWDRRPGDPRWAVDEVG